MALRGSALVIPDDRRRSLCTTSNTFPASSLQPTETLMESQRLLVPLSVRFEAQKANVTGSRSRGIRPGRRPIGIAERWRVRSVDRYRWLTGLPHGFCRQCFACEGTEAVARSGDGDVPVVEGQESQSRYRLPAFDWLAPCLFSSGRRRSRSLLALSTTGCLERVK